MDPYILRIVSRGKTPATGRLEHLPKLWLHAPVRIELTCAAPDDTEEMLDATSGYAISIHSLNASRVPVESPLLWYEEVSPVAANTAKTKGPHAVFAMSAADIANVTAAGEYWIAFHASSGGERILRAAGYITFVEDGFPDSPPTPTPPGTVYLTQSVADSRYVRDPGTVTDNAIVRWNGTSGNLVQNSGVTVSDTGDIDIPGSVSIGSGAGVLGIRADNLTADRTHQAADEDGTLALTDNINGSPDRIEIYVKCAEVGGVTTGQAVYISGASGGNKLITKALASGESTSSKTIGLVMQNLAHNGFGYVVTEGRIEVSLAAGTAAEGDPVWLSPTTAGGLVYGLANKPSAPNHMVFLGYITRINGGTIAQIYVKVQNGFELEELHNVAISSPATSHTIFWNGSRWANRAIGTGDFTGTATTGYVLTVVGGVPTWAAATGGGGSGSTNLAFMQDEDSITITSDTGTDATLPLADSSFAGLMGPGQVTKLAGIAEGATANVGTVTGLAAGTSGTGVTVTVAGTSAVPTVAVSLGAIAPTSVNGVVFSGTSTPTLAVTGTTAVSGTNTGNVTLASSVSSVLALSGQQLQAVTDPVADQILFYDQSASAWAYASLGDSLVMTGTTLSVSLGTPGPIGGTTPGEGTFNQINARTGIDVQATVGSGGPLRVYNTPTTAPADYERGRIEWVSGVLTIGTESIGSGTAKAMALQTAGVTRVAIGATGLIAVNGATAPTNTPLSVKALNPLAANHAAIRIENYLATSSIVEIGGTPSNNGLINIISASSGTIALQVDNTHFPVNVGIGRGTGSFAPAGRLHVRGPGSGATIICRLENSSATARFIVLDNGSFAFNATPTAVETGWTTFTNLTTDRTCDANATTVEELADILGTLIVALKDKGIISA